MRDFRLCLLTFSICFFIPITVVVVGYNVPATISASDQTDSTDSDNPYINDRRD